MVTDHPRILNTYEATSVKGDIASGQVSTFGPNSKRVTIRYGYLVGKDLLGVEQPQIGDYFTIHHGSVIHAAWD